MAEQQTTSPAPAPSAPQAAPAAPGEAKPNAQTPPSAGPSASQPSGPDAAAAKLEAVAGEKAPEQKAGETDQAYELRLAKLTREAQRAQREADTHKAARAKVEEEATALRAELEKAKNKRMTVREYRELTKKLLENPQSRAELLVDDDLPEPMRELKEKMEQQLREAEEAKAAQQRAEQEAAQKAQHARELGIVAEALKSEAVPLFSSHPQAPNHVLQLWYQRWEEMGKQPDRKPQLEAVIGEVHEAFARNLVQALQSKQSRTFLAGLVEDPELKALLGGAEQPAGGPTSGPQGDGGANGRAAAAPVSSPVDLSTLSPEQRRKALQMEALAKAKAEWKERRGKTG